MNLRGIFVGLAVCLAASHSAWAARPVALSSAAAWESSEQDLSPFGKLCIVSKNYDENTRLYIQRSSDNRISLGILFGKAHLNKEKFYRTNILVDILYDKEITARPLSNEEIVFSLGEDMAFLASMEKAREISIGLGEDLYIFTMNNFLAGKSLLDGCLGLASEQYPPNTIKAIDEKLAKDNKAGGIPVLNERPDTVIPDPDFHAAQSKPNSDPVNLVAAIPVVDQPMTLNETGRELKAGYVSKRVAYNQGPLGLDKEMKSPSVQPAQEQAPAQQPESHPESGDDQPDLARQLLDANAQHLDPARMAPPPKPVQDLKRPEEDLAEFQALAGTTNQVVEDITSQTFPVPAKEPENPVALNEIAATISGESVPDITATDLLRAPADNVRTGPATSTAAHEVTSLLGAGSEPEADMARQLEAEEAAFGFTRVAPRRKPLKSELSSSEKQIGDVKAVSPVQEQSALTPAKVDANPAKPKSDTAEGRAAAESKDPALTGKMVSFFKQALPFGQSGEPEKNLVQNVPDRIRTVVSTPEVHALEPTEEAAFVLAQLEPQSGTAKDPVKELLEMKPTDSTPIKVLRKEEEAFSETKPGSVDPALRRKQSEESERLIAIPATGEESGEAIAVYHEMPADKQDRKKGGPILEGTAMLLPEENATPSKEISEPREQIHVFRLGDEGHAPAVQDAAPAEIRISGSSCEILPEPVKKLQPYLTGNKNYDESQEIIENLKIQIRLLEREKEALRSKLPEDPGALSIIRTCVKEESKIVALADEVQKLKVMNFDLIQELGGYGAPPAANNQVSGEDIDALRNNVDELIQINNNLEMQVRELKSRLATPQQEAAGAQPEQTQTPRPPEDITEQAKPAAPEIEKSVPAAP